MRCQDCDLHAVWEGFETFTSVLLDSSFPLRQLVKKRVCCTARIPTTLHDSHEHCCVPSSCIRLVLGIDTSPCCDAVMFHCASDESFRFSSDCVHQEIAQLFRTELHLRSEFCKRFIRQPCERTSGSKLAMAATDSKMNDHSLHSVSRPEKVGHMFITRGSTRRDCSSLGFRRQSLTHFCQCLGQLLHPCHVRSARQSNTMDDQRSATMLQCMSDKSFLDSS